MSRSIQQGESLVEEGWCPVSLVNWRNMSRRYCDIMRVPLSDDPKDDLFRPAINLDQDGNPCMKRDRLSISIIRGEPQMGFASRERAEYFIRGWIACQNNNGIGPEHDPESHFYRKENACSVL